MLVGRMGCNQEFHLGWVQFEMSAPTNKLTV